MGDIVEITAPQTQSPLFYTVSAGALSFEIKGQYGVLGLADHRSLDKPCQYYVIFDRENKMKIKGHQGVWTSDTIPSIGLSHTQYKRFWIAWDSRLLRVGLDRESTHIYSYPITSTNLNYVIFKTKAPYLVSWRFELPPAPVVKLSSTPCKPVAGGELSWVQADAQLPDGAVVGGFDGGCLYIVRGQHRGSLTPGKFVPSEGAAYVPWGGLANEVPEFEILVGYNFMWVPTSRNRIPVNAFVAGHSEVNQEKLYIGRVRHMNCLIPGKVQPSHKVCYIPFEDKEVSFKNYEILTVPDSNPYADKNFLSTSNAYRNRHIYVSHDDSEEEYDDEDHSDGDEDSDQFMLEEAD